MKNLEYSSFLSAQDQIELCKALKQCYLKKTDKELDEMLQQLVDAGGVEGYIKRVNGKITRIGVMTNDKELKYFEPEIDTDHPWLYKD